MDLSRLPRRHYTNGPTPIERLPRLTAQLGGPEIFIKRDDMLGLAGGGNKTRKLEFLVADALRSGADTLITCGAVQSNHCRLTLAAAVREGLKCRLVLEQRVPDSYRKDASGNNLLYHLLGAEDISVVSGDADVGAAMDEVADSVRSAGGVPYIIAGGASEPLGATGYVVCANEVVDQAFELGMSFDAVVCASGSGGTHAGLLVGLLARRSRARVVGISVRHAADRQRARIRELAHTTTDFLDMGIQVPDDSVICIDDYVGPGYSLPTDEMVEAVRLLASTEGVLLDPVYTGKAMSGLIGLCRRGYFHSGEKILFIHTGGVPGLYAYSSLFL